MDYYGKDSVTTEEVYRCLMRVLHPMSARRLIDDYLNLCSAVRAGYSIIINDRDGYDPQWHNGNGHAQHGVTEGGLRTMVTRPGQSPLDGYRFGRR